MRWVESLHTLGLGELRQAGLKCAALGEIARHVPDAGVPAGFVLRAEAVRSFLRRAEVEALVVDEHEGLHPEDVDALAARAARIRAAVLAAELPDAIHEQLVAAWRALDADQVVVRASVSVPDLASAPPGGLYRAVAGVKDEAALVSAVKEVVASRWQPAAMSWHATRNRPFDAVLAVGVQTQVLGQMAGTLYTAEPDHGLRSLALVTASAARPSAVTGGLVDPDEVLVHLPSLERGCEGVVGRRGTLPLGDLPGRLAALGLRAQAVWQRSGSTEALELDWIGDPGGEIHLVEVRPLHGQGRDPWRYEVEGPALLRGRPIGHGAVVGPVRRVRSPADLAHLRRGDVLVAERADASWTPVLGRVAGLVLEHGGRSCFTSRIARELGLPCAIGVDGAMELRDGQQVTLVVGEEDQARVYDGPVEVKQLDLHLPEGRVGDHELYVRVDRGGHGLRLARLPVAGAWLPCPMPDDLALVGAAFWPRPVLLRMPVGPSGDALRVALTEARRCAGLTNLWPAVSGLTFPEQVAAVKREKPEAWLLAEAPVHAWRIGELAAGLPGVLLELDDPVRFVLGDRDRKQGEGLDYDSRELVRALRALLDGAPGQVVVAGPAELVEHLGEGTGLCVRPDELVAAYAGLASRPARS